MHLSRLVFFSAVFIGLSAAADAQYTSKTTSSGLTSKTTTSASPKSVTASASSATQANTYTKSAAPTAAKTSATQARPVFRPRSQVVEKTVSDDDDELPSFERLEGKSTSPTQQKSAEELPPPPPPKGEIWFYITNFAHNAGKSSSLYCNWDVVIQNRTDADLDLKVFFTLANVASQASVSGLKSNSSKVIKKGIYSSRCLEMALAKPKIGVHKCKLGTVVDSACEAYIVIK